MFTEKGGLIMSESLATKYRPQDFEHVVSQKSITKILNRQLELNDIHNTYLFCGSSGCGKTTAARIFASKINNIPYQKNMPGVIEIDAASNNGVDNIREIVKSASERSVESKYKVYIIDECHSLTNQSWQAFLKCIEEPPTYTVFIFCTTDPQKIPTTIINRCMRFNFSRIPSDLINERLRYICTQEGYTNFDETCEYISRISDGGMRTAISILEKCASYDNELNISNCLAALGNYSYKCFFDLIDFIIDGNEQMVVDQINQIYMDGGDLKLFVEQFTDFCLDISKYILCNSFDICKIPQTYNDRLLADVNFQDSGKYYNYVLDRLMELRNILHNDCNVLMTCIIYFMRIARCQ